MSTNNTPAKRKKLPACDYCKTRRVLCHPQLDGSCPRCLEKGVNCTTTPVIRRKRRTKAQLAESSGGAGSSSISPAEAPLPSAGNTVALTLPPSLELPAAIVEKLIGSFCSPYITHPLMSPSEIKTLLADLSSLQPQERVLLHCLMAFSSLLSMSPFVIGTEEVSAEQLLIFSTSSPLKAPIIPDLRQIGFQREPVFLQLWAEALWLANQEGIATNPTNVNAASCWVLGHIAQVVLGKGASPFNSAFVCHVRCLAEEGNLDDLNTVRYHWHMMGDVLGALTTGKSIQYTPNDEPLLVCHTPEPLEKLIRDSTTKSFTAGEAFRSIHGFAHHIIRLARETSENLTSVFARRQPLDESFLIKHFASLDLFHSFLIVELDQIARIVQQSHHNPLHAYYLRLCAHGFVASWGSLVLTIFEALRDRSLQFAFNATLGGSSNGFVTSLADDRNHERLQMHLRHARRLASTAAVEMYKALREVPSITPLLQHSELVKWTRFLMDEDNVVDINHEQHLQALECFRDAIQVAGFYCADRTGIVESVNEYLASSMKRISTRNDYSTGFEALYSFTAVSSINSLVPLA
ncbi:hypothetical protein BT96DRAFT_1017868 [Gymnopus androsaceus JB14]|uniref:Zn(2)-C6 fungal-type domain-containing protein n=1 Tax=Gymnopus androsaceus JB14 TaxID=1447944 RepID=A0A6A4HZM7_9AGAR|nr:hypothetical protein BT96DRAFT_1017868 [Gymnopus androsaceus JB14]